MFLFLFASGGTLGIGMLFWILMILWLLFGFWANWTPAPNYRVFGGHLLLWFLLFLIGWEIFGFPVGK